MLTGFFAASVLFIKYQLEEFRLSFQSDIASRIGAELNTKSVQVNGLHGLRIEEFVGTLQIPDGPLVEVRTPEVFVNVDLLDIFYRKITIEEIIADQTEITLTRPVGTRWLKDDLSQALNNLSDDANFGFRILSKGSSVRVNNVVGTTNVDLDQVEFDIARYPNASDILATITGLIDGNPLKKMHLKAQYSDLSNFNVQIHNENISSNDIQIFLPAQQHFLQSGTSNPRVRITGYPERTIVISLELPFEDFQLRDQPEWLGTMDGHLTALANYDLDAKLLKLTTANAETSEMGGRLTGTIDFAEELPEFNLLMEADRIPVDLAMNNLFNEQFEEFGNLKIALEPPFDLAYTIQGTSENPVFAIQTSLTNASLSLEALTENSPTGTLNFGLINVNWDSTNSTAQGSLNIQDGTLTHPGLGLELSKITGVLQIKENTLHIAPLHANLKGNPITGEATYNPETKAMTFDINGTIGQLQNTPLASLSPKLQLNGSTTIRCKGDIKPERYLIDLSADLTQSNIQYEWWLNKPLGMGTTLNAINIDVTPGKSAQIAGNIGVDNATLNTALKLVQQGDDWKVIQARIKTDSLDVNVAGKCLTIPYAITGTQATNGYFEWTPDNSIDGGYVINLGGQIDQATCLPRGTKAPLHGNKLDVKCTLTRSNAGRKGTLSLNGEQVALPSFNSEEDWILPIRPADPELAKQYPPLPRNWTYSLASNAISIPPWEGTQFTANAISTSERTVFESFKGTLGEGTLEGTYTHEKGDNLAIFTAQWDKLPAKYLLSHLNLPPLLIGNSVGEITYTMDLDDPDTLKGLGKFEIQNGSFSADFLADQVEEKLEGDLSALPPKRYFKTIRSEVILEGDVIKTPNLALQSDGIAITGNGQFITDGDMNYQISVALSPETVERLPMFSEYFNLEGFKLTQNTIDLTFNITGPTFNPSGRLTQLPSAGVTIVGGALELTSEAVKVVDLPRQILLDLFRIGGGLLGPG